MIGIRVLAIADEGERNAHERVVLTEGAETDEELILIISGNSNVGEINSEEGVGADITKRRRQGELTAKTGVSEGVGADKLKCLCRVSRKGGKRVTAVEGKVGDLDYTHGECDIRETLTAVERALIHTVKARPLGEVNLTQLLRISEGVVVYSYNARGNLDLAKILSTEEGTVAYREQIDSLGELYAVERRALKSAEAYLLDTDGKSEAAAHTCGYGYDLRHIRRVEDTVKRSVIGITIIGGKCVKLLERNEREVLDNLEVSRNMEGCHTRLVEGVSTEPKAIHGIGKAEGLELCRTAEGAVTHLSHTLGNADRYYQRVREHFHGDLGNSAAILEGDCRHAAAAEDSSTESGDGGGDNYLFGYNSILEGGLLDNSEARARIELNDLNGTVCEGGVTDKLYRCGNLHIVDVRADERLFLDGDECLGEIDIVELGVGERAAAYNRYVSEIEIIVKVDDGLGGIYLKLKYSDISVGKHGVGHRTVGLNRGNAEIVGLDAVVPVLIKIHRKSLGGEVELELLISQEGERTDVLHALRDAHGSKLVASVKGISADARYSSGNAE